MVLLYWLWEVSKQLCSFLSMPEVLKVWSTNYMHQDHPEFWLKRLPFGLSQAELFGDRTQKSIFLNKFFSLFLSALWFENHCPIPCSLLAIHLKCLWKRLFQGAQRRGRWPTAIPFHTEIAMKTREPGLATPKCPWTSCWAVVLDPTWTFQNYNCYLNFFQCFHLVGLNTKMSAEDDAA